MNLKALITTALVLGTSTVALASPRQSAPTVRDHRDRAELDVRFGYNTRPVESRSIEYRSPARPVITYPAPSAPVYEQRGMATVASFNRAFDGMQRIDLGCEARPASLLRITSNDPNSEIYSVVVHFQDGQSQTFLWNHIFGSASDGQLGPHLDMNVAPGAVIQRIDVSARSNARLSVQLKA